MSANEPTPKPRPTKEQLERLGWAPGDVQVEPEPTEPDPRFVTRPGEIEMKP